MNSRRGPLSPIKTEIRNESTWNSGGAGYRQSTDIESQYSPIVRNQLATPPISSGYGNPMNGYSNMSAAFQRPESGRTSAGGPSPPASIARSSNGASLYHGSTLHGSEVGVGGGTSRRAGRDDQFEATLSEHYMSLKRYLASSLRDEKGNPRPNKARDKLLRLSPVQFHELSTDVYDELQRRQEAGRRANDNDSTPSPYLLPKDSFHPKRNQARQKLSTLPPPRFRDLATDVFYELERRFPKFVDYDMNGSDVSAGVIPTNRTGTPIEQMRPGSRAGGMPNDPRMRRPSVASSVGQYSHISSRDGGSRTIPNGAGLGVPASPARAVNDYGRPLPKTMQSNTIIPLKSTMVEDSDAADDDDDEDAFALETSAQSSNGMPKNNTYTRSQEDQKAIDDYEAQIANMRERVETLEDSLKRKDEALNESLELERQRSTIASAKDQEMLDLRHKLEGQHAEALNLNMAIQSELDRVHTEKADTEKSLRSQIEGMQSPHGKTRNPGESDLQQENEELRRDLREQQEISEEVRREAEEFLREMKMLTERSGSSWEREEQLMQQVAKLEQEVKVWRDRYTRTKSQLRSLRASSIGLSIESTSAFTQDSSFRQDDGMVKDVHVTKFQIAIDELLQASRGDLADRVIDHMKSVVVAVRNITQDMDTNGTQLSTQQLRLKSRVSVTANNLITAARNFASAKGLSPVSLLDAAASHLTAAVVELVRTVKIRPTPAGEHDDDDEPSTELADFPQGTQDLPRPAFIQRSSYASSVYSTNTTPRNSIPRPRSNHGEWQNRPMSSSFVNGRPISSRGMPNGRSSFALANNRALPAYDTDHEDLKIYLEDQTATLVAKIQTLVTSIRSESPIPTITTTLGQITHVVTAITTRTTQTLSTKPPTSPLLLQTQEIVAKLRECNGKIGEKIKEGERLVEGDGAQTEDELDEMWRVWNASLPPLAFEVARETKELVQRVEFAGSNVGGVDSGTGTGTGTTEGRDADDFS